MARQNKDQSSIGNRQRTTQTGGQSQGGKNRTEGPPDQSRSQGGNENQQQQKSSAPSQNKRGDTSRTSSQGRKLASGGS